jgi:hypothetical protein
MTLCFGLFIQCNPVSSTALVNLLAAPACQLPYFIAQRLILVVITQIIVYYRPIKIQPVAHPKEGTRHKKIRLVQESQPREKDIQFLSEALSVYNTAQVGYNDAQRVAIFLRDEEGKIQGGISGYTYWGWLAIDFFMGTRLPARSRLRRPPARSRRGAGYCKRM